jgi:ATP-dependent RNA helicase RhlE
VPRRARRTGAGADRHRKTGLCLPILQRLRKGASRQTRALIVAPTRGLAEQIHQTIVDPGKGAKVKSISIYGGVSKGLSRRIAARRGDRRCPVPAVCSTISTTAASTCRTLRLVLDEADRMCDMGSSRTSAASSDICRRSARHFLLRHHAAGYPRPGGQHPAKNPATVQIDDRTRGDRFSRALSPRRLKTKLLLGDVAADGHRAGPDLHADQTSRATWLRT